MIRPAAIRIKVLRTICTHGEEWRKNLLNTEISKKPMTKLTSSTFNSRSKMALRVLDPGSWYLNKNESVLNCIRKRRKSARVQLIAIIMMIGNLRLFTTDPLGNIIFERLMNHYLQLFCHQPVMV